MTIIQEVQIMTLGTSVAAFVSGVVAAYRTVVLGTKIQEVHVLVNSRLSAALDKISDLQNRVEDLSKQAIDSRNTGIPPPEPPPLPSTRF